MRTLRRSTLSRIARVIDRLPDGPRWTGRSVAAGCAARIDLTITDEGAIAQVFVVISACRKLQIEAIGVTPR